MKKQTRNLNYAEMVIILVIGVIAAVIPFFTKSRYWTSLGINIFVMGAFGTAWNIIGGYAGQIGFAHSAFFSIGAYAAVIMYLKLGITPWIGMLVGAAVSVLAALFIGSITLRFKGPYFMLCTIAFTKCVETIFTWKKDITNGLAGMVIPIKGNHFETLIFKDTINYYYIFVVALVLALIVAWYVYHSKSGYYMRAIKADVNAAESLGIKSSKYKIMAFIISAIIVSLLGSIYAFYMAYIDPTSIGGVELSTRILCFSVIGGIGNLFGPLLGAAVLTPCIDFVNSIGPNGSGTLIYGVALILIMRFRPNGLISFIVDERGKVRFLKKREKSTEVTEHE